MAAQATECAADQSLFWAYHDALFTAQVPEHNVGNFSVGNLEKLAGTLGMDSGTFNTCLQSGRYAGYVQKAADTARARGVTGTPTLFVNGTRIKTPASFDDFLQALNTV